MKLIKTELTNATYRLDGCNGLPAVKYKNADNSEQGIETCWELEPEEIEQVCKTKKIYLYIQGGVVPPVLLTTESMVYIEEENE